jgi:hypothetical protein
MSQLKEALRLVSRLQDDVNHPIHDAKHPQPQAAIKALNELEGWIEKLSVPV